MIQALLSFIGETGWTVRAVAKITAMALGAVIALSIGIAVLSTVARVAFSGWTPDTVMQGVAPMVAPSASMGYGGVAGMAEMASDYMGGDVYGTKMANVAYDTSSSIIAPMPPMAVNGSRNAEKYERTDYSANFMTRRFTETCDAVEAWKPLEYVIFDTANRSEQNCWYAFRVATAHADEVLAKVKALKPDDMSVNVQTVAQSIENTADRITILKRRLASVDATLASAERAYDQAIGEVRGSSVGNLGALVTDKLNTVERLTNEKLSLDEQISSLEQGKDDQLDETAYTHFSVSVSKVSFIDWKSLGDKWRYAVQQAVNDVSDIFSGILLSIPVFALRIVWFALVGLISIIALVVFARVARNLAVMIWHWGPRQ